MSSRVMFCSRLIGRFVPSSLTPSLSPFTPIFKLGRQATYSSCAPRFCQSGCQWAREAAMTMMPQASIFLVCAFLLPFAPSSSTSSSEDLPPELQETCSSSNDASSCSRGPHAQMAAAEDGKISDRALGVSEERHRVSRLFG